MDDSRDRAQIASLDEDADERRRELHGGALHPYRGSDLLARVEALESLVADHRRLLSEQRRLIAALEQRRPATSRTAGLQASRGAERHRDG